MYSKGDRRKKNRQYDNLLGQSYRLRKRGQYKEAAKVRKAAQKLPSVDLLDPGYRRLKYVRYADDWLLGLIGTREDVEQIKQQVKTFLQEDLKLELSDEKTLITHARTQPARFLSYHISTSQDDTRQTKKKRSVNGTMRLRVPPDLLRKKCQKYQKNNKPIHRKELTNNTEYSIMAQYQSEFRGFAEYYQLANDLHRLNSLKWIMQQSLTKTLAAKLKLTAKQVYKKYEASWTIDGRTYKGLQITVEREGKKPLVANWGDIPLKRKLQAIINDQPPIFWASRTELEKRLLANTCELCRSRDRVEVHHIRARNRSRPERKTRETAMGKSDVSPQKKNTRCMLVVSQGHPHRKSCEEASNKKRV